MNRIGSIMGAYAAPVVRNRMGDLAGNAANATPVLNDDVIDDLDRAVPPAVRDMRNAFGGLGNFHNYLQRVTPSPRVEVRGWEPERKFNYTIGPEVQREMDAEDADEAETRPTFKPENDPASDFNTAIYNLMQLINRGSGGSR